MTPSTTKKWKWTSVCPPARCTSIADATISPRAATTERTRRLHHGRGDRWARTMRGNASVSACSAPSPLSRLIVATTGTCSHSNRTIQRWRWAHATGSTWTPTGTVAARRLMTSVTEGTCAHRQVERGPLPNSPVPRGFSWCERSEEHTSELQSLMRISYSVFCLTKTTSHHPYLLFLLFFFSLFFLFLSF